MLKVPGRTSVGDLVQFLFDGPVKRRRTVLPEHGGPDSHIWELHVVPTGEKIDRDDVGSRATVDIEASDISLLFHHAPVDKKSEVWRSALSHELARPDKSEDIYYVVVSAD